MNIPRFWARASISVTIPSDTEPFATEAFGHSDTSVAAAEEDARQRALRVAAWYEGLSRDADIELTRRYGYGDDRPLREPIEREFGSGADRFAVITRNAYGSLVLNCASVCFIDVDLAPKPGRLARLFGKRVPDAEALLASMREAADAARVGVRIYRTRAGFRGLITSELVDPMSRRSEDLMERFGSDPKYRALCRVQRCFRARLTPKPWRCGLLGPTWPWPFRGPEHAAAFRAWLATYEEAIRAYATCELVETRGPAGQHPLAATIVREHDAMACRSGCPLA